MPIYKQKDGGYLVRINFTDEFGRYTQITRKNEKTRTLAGARKVEAELLLKYKPDSNAGNSEILRTLTIGQLVEEYTRDQNGRKKTTVSTTKKRLMTNIIPYFKNTRVSELNVRQVHRWKTEMDKKNLSIVTKQGIYHTFVAIINYAMKYYGLPTNEVKREGNFKDSSEKKKKMSFWTYEQFSLFIQELRKECEKTPDNIDQWSRYVFFNILFFVGTRKGEAYALRWKDFLDYDCNKLNIDKSICFKVSDGEHHYIESTTKNKSSTRCNMICKELQNIILEHYERCKKIYKFSKDWFLCGNLEPMKDTTICKIKDELGKKLGLPHIRIHDLRHSFASFCISLNINIETISRLMGHANVTETWNTYGHLYPTAVPKAVDAIDEFIKSKKM